MGRMDIKLCSGRCLGSVAGCLVVPDYPHRMFLANGIDWDGSLVCISGRHHRFLVHPERDFVLTKTIRKRGLTIRRSRR